MTKKAKTVPAKRSYRARFVEGIFVGFGIGVGVVAMQVLTASTLLGIKLFLSFAGF